MRGRRIIWCVLSCFLLTVPVLAGERDIVLHVTSVPSTWGRMRLDQRIVEQFSRTDDWRPHLVSGGSSEHPPFPEAGFDFDSLSAWGNEIGGRYLLVVRVDREALEHRRTFNLPLVFQRYEAFGIIDAEVRLLDLKRVRLLWAEPLTVELRGPRIVQAHPDDNRYDADIHLTARQKLDFFDRLERRFAAELNKQTLKAIRHRR